MNKKIFLAIFVSIIFVGSVLAVYYDTSTKTINRQQAISFKETQNANLEKDVTTTKTSITYTSDEVCEVFGTDIIEEMCYVTFEYTLDGETTEDAIHFEAGLETAEIDNLVKNYVNEIVEANAQAVQESVSYKGESMKGRKINTQ